MRGDADRVMSCTTAQFDGVIAMIRPDESWVVSSRASLTMTSLGSLRPLIRHPLAHRRNGNGTVRST